MNVVRFHVDEKNEEFSGTGETSTLGLTTSLMSVTGMAYKGSTQGSDVCEDMAI